MFCQLLSTFSTLCESRNHTWPHAMHCYEQVRTYNAINQRCLEQSRCLPTHNESYFFWKKNINWNWVTPMFSYSSVMGLPLHSISQSACTVPLWPFCNLKGDCELLIVIVVFIGPKQFLTFEAESLGLRQKWFRIPREVHEQEQTTSATWHESVLRKQHQGSGFRCSRMQGRTEWCSRISCSHFVFRSTVTCSNSWINII